MRNFPKFSVTAPAALLLVLAVIAVGLLSGPAGLKPEPQSAEAALLNEVKKLLASDAQASDAFGFSVAVSGDTAVVGAPFEAAGGFDAGAAYVFQRDQAGAAYVFQRDEGGTDNWGEVTKLTASDAQAGDNFGNRVAVSGDTVVAGAPQQFSGGAGAGAAYVFQRDQGGAGNWGQVKKLTASDAQANDLFGNSVAVSGDTAVVGAVFEDAGGIGSLAGAAYVFQRDQGGADNWGQVKKLTASDAQAFDIFGQSVAVSGDTAVVGAALEDAEGTDTGAAYVFARDQGGADNWGEVTKFTASDAEANDSFGVSVAVSGDTAVVGAWLEAFGGTDAGAAYVFQRDQDGADNWGEVKKLTASDAQANDLFGNSVAVSGDTAVVGARGADAGGTDAGAAYVFGQPAPTPTPTPTPTITSMPTPRPTPTPKNPAGDTDGDTILNETDPNDDNDACTDEQELGPDEAFGGRRNPHNFWDWFDPNQDGSVTVLDFFALLQRFAAVGDPDIDPLSEPDPPPAYHTRFDRGPVVGKHPWNAGPPDGAIVVTDFFSLLAQFGHTCA